MVSLDTHTAPQACAACKKRKGAHSSLPSFPAVFFLDHDMFQASRMELPPAGTLLPSYVTTELGDSTQSRQIASHFFSTVHHWMPIVSKRRFLECHLNPLTAYRADAALLCLSMKLVLWTPVTDRSDPRTTTYHAAKRHLHELDLTGCLTLLTLQAAILIAVYEIGHAIYPAAHLSVTACAQYAATLGLGWTQVERGGRSAPWVEMEERRRVWWAIVILERYLSLGWHERPILTDGPASNELLPSDDAAWNAEIEAPNHRMTASPATTSTDINMSPFARLAQAAYLLDCVQRHINDRTMTAKQRDEEAFHLDKALRALMTFTTSEIARRQMRLCCQMALCHRYMVS
ncbi:uncharacterized protein N7515_000049 [Penicillium bovifimosum]|uniref:Xylanolytic transcriptional activator regulatory domain-containing protein n=1 Tax=Penicillium bovifimosum TaxID=126998 RepID=A0A9W9HGH2_9EURO|nr:uncharacterized protein N7515_000049 [Penicillium bovifimosum]KAJ5145485.1 hypothetical protein N7515_000049 [Penicillium bovifimosum]